MPYSTRNGWVDDGHKIGSPGEKCPNCGSDQYYQTVSIEHCPTCGLKCDYWCGGANSVYRAMMDRHADERKKRAEEEEDEY